MRETLEGDPGQVECSDERPYMVQREHTGVRDCPLRKALQTQTKKGFADAAFELSLKAE